MLRLLLLTFLGCAAVGCARIQSTYEGVGREDGGRQDPPLPAVAPDHVAIDRRAVDVFNGLGAAREPDPAPTPTRRVIYNANLEVLVEDFEKARQELLELVDEFKGFVAASDTGRSPGLPRTGAWTVRVPAARFPAFVEAATRLGEPLRNRTDAQDVTEQFVDLEARLKNKRAEEEQLQKILRESAGKLTEVLEVSKELFRVRGEIEQVQGRLQKLTDLTELSTVTVSLRERRDYVPPQSPTFGTAVGRTFRDSFGLLVDFGQWLVLFAVALVPWLPVIALVLGAGWLVARRRRMRPIQPVAVPGGE